MREERQFQTESRQILDLMINSIYSNKEIFLREIISNASDAIDKYKFLSLSDISTYPSRDYRIDISVDKENRTITVRDNGIGMTKEDLISSLGVIAKSGSKDFLAKYKEMKDNEELNIIGQFGVGFYSIFMVADKVEVRTCAVDNTKSLFSSDGKESYIIEDLEDDNFTGGTSVTMYLKANTEELNYDQYLDEHMIEALVKKYSDYIRYPIHMDVEKEVPELDEEGKEIEGKTRTEIEDKVLNSMIPLWKKSKSQVEEKDLNEFYKSHFDDYEDPLLAIQLKVEGTLCYNGLIFIPKRAPYNLYSENYEKGLELYSKGIFIQEKCKDLIPDFLKFTKGLVDSDDFPLNISREMLQKSPLLTKIAKNIEAKIVDKLKEMQKEDPEKYEAFFKEYGNYIKFGIYSTYGGKKDELQDLLLFPSLNEEKMISFKAYKEKMKEEDKNIYYASGRSLDEIKMLPQIERFRKREKDVLLLSERIDEFTLMVLHEYDGKEFKNIAAEDREDLSTEEKEKIDALTSEHKRILDEMTEALKGKVDEVNFSSHLVDSPVCITTKDGLSLNMEHVLSEQPEERNTPEEMRPKARKILEINPDHDLFKAISKVTDDALIREYGELFYDEALLLEGYEIEDKRAFVARLNKLMINAK